MGRFGANLTLPHNHKQAKVASNNQHVNNKQNFRSFRDTPPSAEELVRINDVEGLDGLLSSQGGGASGRKCLYINGELWRIALERPKRGCMALFSLDSPNIPMLSLLAFYEIPMGTHEQEILNAFNTTGLFGYSPKEALIHLCNQAVNNKIYADLLRQGLLDGKHNLLKILCTEPNGTLISNNKWEVLARGALSKVEANSANMTFEPSTY